MIIKDGKVKIQTNTGFDEKGVEIVNNLINKSSSQNIILSVRTEKEPHADNYPAIGFIKKIRNNKNNKNIVLFNQEPWPQEVPNFSNSNLVIRFGFDERCEFDKLQLNSPLPLSELGLDSNDPKYQNKTYHYLVNNRDQGVIDRAKRIINTI